MGPKLPTIGVGQKVELAIEMLETAPALLVLSGGRPLSVLTRTDVLAYFGAVADASTDASTDQSTNGSGNGTPDGSTPD